MLATPSALPSQRKLSAVDQFCTQTYPTADREARYARAVATTLGIICVVLLVCLAIVGWRANAMEQERDQLIRQLGSERSARLNATLAAKDVEMSTASYDLETRVRRDLIDERTALLERRSAELQQLAARIERERLVAADCATPRSILTAAGL